MRRYEHKGPGHDKLGRKVVYALDDVEAWVTASRVASASLSFRPPPPRERALSLAPTYVRLS